MSALFDSIILENFRSFAGTHEFKLDRRPGLYFVRGKNLKEPKMGANGSGKSTLFVDGPFWALRGRTVRAKRPGSAVQPWAGASPTRVLLRCAGHVVERGRAPNLLKLDGTIVEQSAIDALLPVSDDVLQRSIIIGQFGDSFLDMAAEKQSQLFTETLDLEVWIAASKLAHDEALHWTREYEEFKRRDVQLDGQIKELEKELKHAIKQSVSFDAEQKVLVHECRQALKEATNAVKLIKDDPVEAPQAAKPDTTLALKLRSATEHLSGATGALLAAQRILKSAKTRLRQYTDEKESRCPECGQAVERAHFRRAKARAEREAVEAQETINAAQVELDKAKTEVARLEKLSEAQSARAFKQQSQHEEYGRYKFRLATAEDRERQASKALADQEAASNPHEASIKRIEKRLMSLRGELETNTRDTEEVARARVRAECWATGFKEIRLARIESVLSELQVSVNRHAEGLGLEGWQIQFHTSRETASGSVSVKFNAMLFPPDMDKPVPWESYCGGEVQRLNLAVSFGMAEVLLDHVGLQPNVEIIDEPTAHLSAEGVDDLLAYLYDRAHDLGRAIYLIDHRSLDRGAFDGVFTVTKTKGGSQITEG